MAPRRIPSPPPHAADSITFIPQTLATPSPITIPLYYQQTTTSLLSSALVFTFVVTLASLLLFSWLRTRRGSIYGSRRFFVRQEHRAEALPDGFFGWIGGLLFLETRLEQEEDQELQSRRESHTPSMGRDQHQTDRAPVDSQLPAHNKLPFWRRAWTGFRPLQRGANACKPPAYSSMDENSSIYPPATPSASTHPRSTHSQPLSSSGTTPILSGRQALIANIGLDHYLLIRFLRMLLSLSFIIAVLASLVLVPLYSVAQSGEDYMRGLKDTPPGTITIANRVEMLQISNVTDDERLWVTVMATGVISALILLWTWSELMIFLKLRKEYLLRSASRYSSRVVLLQHIPADLRSVAALQQLFSTAPGGGVEHVYLVRDIAMLEQAVKRRQVVLSKLEETESKYMDAIARASALAAITTLSMRSRSWLGNCLDRVIACLGLTGSGSGAALGAEDEDYVGPLKLYQLDHVPKLSLTDFTNTSAAANGASSEDGSGAVRPHRHSTGSNMSSLVTTLKWYQKPRRPKHYVGLPLLTKRQDSIRYYRGELSRLNKIISQAYDEQASAIVADQQEFREALNQQPQDRSTISPQAGQSHGLESKDTINETGRPTADKGSDGTATTTAINIPGQLHVLPSVFVLMKTRAGAKAVASGMYASDRIPSSARTLGISPRDIEWRVVAQARSMSSHVVGRASIVAVGVLLLIGCGMVVAAIASMTASDGWERVSLQKVPTPVAASSYMRQGILAPMLLTCLMMAASWILNELCLYWGRVSKSQTELLIQRCYYVFLAVNMVAIHPALSLYFSWQESSSSVIDSLVSFLSHAIPSYCSFAFAYILISGIGMSAYQLLQLRRLWATLPSLTLWSVFGPLSWRKMTRSASCSESKSEKDSNESAATHGVAASSSSVSSSDSCFDANFASAPTLTPRQAFQLRQPPFFNLQDLYLVLQVVTTKSQSGGLHFRQALRIILCPTLALPPLLLALYLGVRGAWIQCGFTIVLMLGLMLAGVVVSKQFRKREETMLLRVEERYAYQQQQRRKQQRMSMKLDRSKQDSAIGVSANGRFGLATPITAAFPNLNANLEYTYRRSGVGPLEDSPEDLDRDRNGPVAGSIYLSQDQGASKVSLPRPLTIIGHVRSSIVSSISSNGTRPKSVPVFDLNRYERDILGMDKDGKRLGLNDPDYRDKEKYPDMHAMEDADFHQAMEDDDGQLSPRSTNSNNIGDTWYTTNPFSVGALDGVESSIPAATGTDEEEKEAKYREIVKALRRASSVASKNLIYQATGDNEQTMSSTRQTMSNTHQTQQRRDRVGGSIPLSSSRLEPSTTNTTTMATTLSAERRERTNLTTQANKAQFRVSFSATPQNIIPRQFHYNSNPYLMHQPSFSEAMAGASGSSTLPVAGPSCGGPSFLPMLLMHRETVVAATELNVIHNLFLNPVLQEARSRAIVWLPSQTERSFWGAHRKNGPDLRRCAYHSGLKEGSVIEDVASTVSAHGLSTFGHSASTLAVNDAHPSGTSSHIDHAQRKRTSACTCHIYREVMKAVADAVALADQEIRDLRIVGLAVWLDSRHVIWGQVNEEDGRLGDRVMISSNYSAAATSGAQTGNVQRQIGDGLLSWIEVQEDGNESEMRPCMGQGAPGIIGGSTGVIIKRPIGYYGRLVGDGEEDDVIRGFANQ
ncbi:Transmembrane protein 63C [Dissophora globulifera]|nr:Transmembrane protein 63C [Dissophora globulifera]